nr:MAG: Putative binding domain, N-terminal [Bacteriophage sp.]
MGEIATWSAVKTKVGLGKTGNDCPTKAELLALSSTGTGENYVGLELSNASSYGNNECVKLEDIHKVTYKYTFTTKYSSVSFDALGNPSSSNFGFGFTSTKQKYWDNVANGSAVSVNYVINSKPSWITNYSKPADGKPWKASENLDLTSRSGKGLATQSESGKTVEFTFTQAAASQSWSQTFSVNPTSLSFGATGGTKTFTVTSYKQEYRNGHTYGNQIPLSYTRANTGVTGTGTSVTMANNTSTSAKSGSVVLTQAETNKKLTISCSQSAGYRTYSEITVSGGSVSDIPASGGSRSSFSTMPSYSQTWGWNGSTTGGGTITSGASISYGTAVSAGSLGTTAKARTRVGSLTCTVSLNGKSKSITLDVYQAENKITSTTDGTLVISLSASSYSISNSGGSVNIYASVSIPTTNHWSSGSTSAGSSKSDTPTVSASGTGFSLNAAKTVLTATENLGTSSRSCVVTASYSGATTKKITVTQSAASVSYKYYLAFTSPTGSRTTTRTGLSALGGNNFTVDVAYSFKIKVINGFEVSTRYPLALTVTSKSSWVTNVDITTLSSDNGNYGLTLTLTENTVESTRSGTIKLRQAENDDEGWELTVNITQNAATITYEYVFNLG